MKVILKTDQKLGNRVYKKGTQELPDSMAYNNAFRLLVKSGAVQMVPRDASAQKIQSARDTKAVQAARAARAATLAENASKSAQAASSASHPHLSAAGPAQALLTPAQPILAAEVAQAAPAAHAHTEGVSE